MPIYEFECSSCGNRFERLQKLADLDPTDCPNCANPQVRRCLTAPAFRLAGSGWYETDFKSDKDKQRNLVNDSEAPKNESTTRESTGNESASSNSKPEVKSSAASAEPKPAPKAETKTESNTAPTNSDKKTGGSSTSAT